MIDKHKFSRRSFLGMSAGFGALAALSRFNLVKAAAPPAPLTDYKALVCVFLFGGNDGHNMVVPLADSEYNAYQDIRGGLALAPNELLTINADSIPFGLHYGLPEMRNLYNQGKLAIVANVGNLVKPTTRSDLSLLPNQLFSHADQTTQMQSGAPDGALGTGWGGRTADAMLASNNGSSFPSSVSLSGAAAFSSGNLVQSASLEPGNDLRQPAMTFYPQPAADARALAQKEIVTTASPSVFVNGANKIMNDAVNLNTILRNTVGNPPFTTQFPSTELGVRLREIARFIGLRNTVGIGRQVFFCGMNGFDTHASQEWSHWNLLQQLSQALSAFHAATEEMGVAQQVTTFTTSEFGRTLQPSGSGSDHGWGGHHFVLGGAVRGAAMYGSFPSMSLGAQHFLDSRGILIPGVSLSQYGATLAKWFGVADAQLDSIFPTLPNFAARDLGFMF
jgi:uncharacterized protein (DUF1501 family)